VGASPDVFVDLRTWCTYIDNQMGREDCVGEALVGANWVRVKATGRRGSARAAWALARSRERRNRGDQLLNVGCMPSDAYDAAVSVGIVPIEANEDDLSRMNDVLTWEETVSAVPIPVGSLEPIDNGDLAAIDAALAEGSPATYTQDVDDSYRSLTSSNPVWSGIRSPSLGLHRQVVVGRILVTGAPGYVIWGSWGTGFADGGFAYIPCTAFAGLASEIVIHHGGVILP
jgi:hypothetical protein